MTSVMPRQWIVVQRPAGVTARRREIAGLAGWEIRDEDGHWRVRTAESYRKQLPALLTARHIRKSQFASLKALPQQAPQITASTSALVTEELNRLRRMDSLASEIAQFQLSFPQVSTAQLPDVMKALFARAVMRLPHSELLVVDVAHELAVRYTLAKFLLTAGLAPAQLSGDGLPAGRALTTGGVLGAELFTAPALLALAPYVIGVPAVRARAAAVWLFGRPVAGITFPTGQLIDTVRPASDRFDGPQQRGGGNPPTATAEQSMAFFSWWTAQVNKVLAVATDPVNFADGTSDAYSPVRHWQYLASIERLFRDVAETLADTEYHETAQLRAAYDALDTLEGMRHGTFDTLVTPSHAIRTLQKLQQELPADIAAVALPVCQRAVDALGNVKDGFTRTSTYFTPTGLSGLPGKKGPMDRTWDQATSAYLRRDRNSAHSFLNMDEWEKALLFSHNGTVPRGITGLAFLYLLDLVAHPDRIARKLC
ncbi:hypothetical protein ACIQKB_36720 [Streptomyces sp. NPDC092046]|uniref:hypothetical protein n=1 Tax=Streptomyces sp. NPDC092046 TaxID=3366009 RepID=UPI0037FA04F6